jgi:hypothetical protein
MVEMVRHWIFLEPELMAEVKKLAKEEDRNISNMMRTLIKRGLNHEK